MPFDEAMISLQLMAEEKIGARLRAEVEAVASAQDSASAGLRRMAG